MSSSHTQKGQCTGVLGVTGDGQLIRRPIVLVRRLRRAEVDDERWVRVTTVGQGKRGYVSRKGEKDLGGRIDRTFWS